MHVADEESIEATVKVIPVRRIVLRMIDWGGVIYIIISLLE